MIAKFAPQLAAICKETAVAFKNTNGLRPITKCAKELGVSAECLKNYRWPSEMMTPSSYATVKCAKALNFEESSLILNAVNRLLSVDNAMKSYII